MHVELETALVFFWFLHQNLNGNDGLSLRISGGMVCHTKSINNVEVRERGISK
jgi:hypothetical protein